MNITEMRTKRADLWNSMEAFLSTRRDGSGCLSAEDDATYANMEKDLDKITNEIRREERREALAAELNKPVNAPIVSRPAGAGTEKVGRASDEYRTDFGRMIRRMPSVHNVLEKGTNANGGYLVPTEMEQQIVVGLTAQNVMRQLCKNIVTESPRKIPVAANHSAAAWKAESAAYTESSPTFTEKTLDAYKLTDLIKVSIELIEDSAFDLESYLVGEIAYAFGLAEETAFCVGAGSGSNEPSGLFPTLATGASTAASISTDAVIDLIHSLGAGYRTNAKFLMADSTVAALRKLKDSTGNYIWQPAVQAGQPDRLFGYEVYTSAAVPTFASGNVCIAFGDFNSYWIADRAGRTIQTLNELYSANGQIGFIATERVDATLVDTVGIVGLKKTPAQGG